MTADIHHGPGTGTRDPGRMLKAHLHVHLESTIRASTLRQIAARNGTTIPDRPATFAGFGQFATYNGLVRDCLRRPEDFARIAEEFCADQAAQGVRYVEVTFTAAGHGERLGQPEMPIAAVLDGLAAGQATYGVQCQVLLDHPRKRSVERAWQTLGLARRHRDAGVVGIGMAGAEHHPLAPFGEVCSAARAEGLRLVHHAGETRGPASVREALTVGLADRIGHGIRVLADPELVAELRERAIPLEVCPSSNIALGLVRSWVAHPLPALRAAGLTITVSTDIPDCTGTSLTDEYRTLREVFGYDDTVLAELNRAAIDASFALEETKVRLRRETDAWLASPTG